MNVMKNLMTMCALASAVCLVSCSSDDEMNVNNDGQVRFTAAIGNEAVVATPEPAPRAPLGGRTTTSVSLWWTTARSTSPRYTPTDSSAPRPVKKTFHPS